MTASVESLIELQEAAKLLPGTTPGTLRRWADAGIVAHVRLPGGRLWFDPEDVKALMIVVEPSGGGSGVG
ncbi:hypothetical protein V5R04_00205 [Jonesiaceae bacterium BS-20]|uniref:MerR family transcriptional regulator n=1 Tax=Jonesiaceae bacterium BS-20 TaxID=3120821 RepID=A0AAU7DWM4_9MICO